MASSSAGSEDSAYADVSGYGTLSEQYGQHINILQKENDVLQECVKHNETTKEKLKERLEKLDLQSRSLFRKCTALKKTCKQNKKMAKELIGELELANTKLHDKELEIERLKSELKKATSDLDILTNEIEKYKAKEHDVKDGNANEALEELRQARDDVQELKETVMLLDARLATRDEEIKKLTDGMADIKKDIGGVGKKVDDKMEVMMTELATLKEMMEHRAADNDNGSGKSKDDDDACNEEEKNTKKSKKPKDKQKPRWRPR